MVHRFIPTVARSNRPRKLDLRFSSNSFVLRVPPSSAPRECPTPLLFVSSSSLDRDSQNGVTFLSSMLAEKGFTCIETDLALPESSTRHSELMMKDYESELVSTVRLAANPFPPIIFARGLACLLAETYISSHPASGMVLVSPPISNAHVSKTKLPTKLKEFNYEAKFPIAVVTRPEELEGLRQSNRICREENVDIISVQNLDERRILVELEQWLDKLGI